VLLLDNRALSELIHLTLNHGVYTTRTVVTADQALAAIDEWQPHLVIFDADLGGQRIMQHIAASTTGGHLPTIALSRRGDLKTKLAAFEWGVDDILTIPFAPEELLARVRAVLRRYQGGSLAQHEVLRVGPLELNPGTRVVLRFNQEVELTETEFQILELLMRAPGRIVTRDEIGAVLYRREVSPFERSLDVHVSNLRRKIEPASIRSVRGSGYVIGS